MKLVRRFIIFLNVMSLCLPTLFFILISYAFGETVSQFVCCCAYFYYSKYIRQLLFIRLFV